VSLRFRGGFFPVEDVLIDTILKDLIASVKGAQAAIFLDGDGEAISNMGDSVMDIKLLGAWKEIHLDQIRDITRRLGLGDVTAVLFSQDEGNAIMTPVVEDYCLLLFLSALADTQGAMAKLKETIALLKKDIE
jgi:predicted regulator of Ras-like GTPase activity (Roadblock/LC7/MglB family)